MLSLSVLAVMRNYQLCSVLLWHRITKVFFFCCNSITQPMEIQKKSLGKNKKKCVFVISVFNALIKTLRCEAV